jgi:Domain of unknown function (DUF4232)
MTNFPDDRIDPYESRLARRVGEFADQAVRPADHAAIAAAAREGARRRSISARLFGSTPVLARSGLILVGAIVAGTALGVFLNAGGNGRVLTGTNDPAASPTAVPGAAEACVAEALTGQIVAWEGAAGHRIATITIHNTGAVSCLLPQYLRPALIDGAGRALMIGEVAESEPITFPAGADAASYIDMVNSCIEPAEPPYRIRLYLPDQGSFELRVAASVPAPIDLPPCNGPAGPGEIGIQPIHLTSPRS